MWGVIASLTWHAWSMLCNRWWGGVGCNSIVDLAHMVDATQQMVGWGVNSIVDLARMVDATQKMVGWGGV